MEQFLMKPSSLEAAASANLQEVACGSCSSVCAQLVSHQPRTSRVADVQDSVQAELLTQGFDTISL